MEGMIDSFKCANEMLEDNDITGVLLAFMVLIANDFTGTAHLLIELRNSVAISKDQFEMIATRLNKVASGSMAEGLITSKDAFDVLAILGK